MSFFDFPEKKEALHVRVPGSLKDRLLATAKLWTLVAAARGRPEDIDITHVCIRLLDVALDGAWKEVGDLAGIPGMPKDDAEWTQLRKALERACSDERASRAKDKRHG